MGVVFPILISQFLAAFGAEITACDAVAAMLAKLLGRCGGRRRHGVAADVLGHVVDDAGDVLPIFTPVHDLSGHSALGIDRHQHLIGRGGGDGDLDDLTPRGKGDAGGEIKGHLIG